MPFFFALPSPEDPRPTTLISITSIPVLVGSSCRSRKSAAHTGFWEPATRVTTLILKKKSLYKLWVYLHWYYQSTISKTDIVHFLICFKRFCNVVVVLPGSTAPCTGCLPQPCSGAEILCILTILIGEKIQWDIISIQKFKLNKIQTYVKKLQLWLTSIFYKEINTLQ